MTIYDKIIYIIQKLFKVLDGVDSEVYMFGDEEYKETPIPKIHLNEDYMVILVPINITKTSNLIIDIHHRNSLYLDVGQYVPPNWYNYTIISFIEIDPYMYNTIKVYSELYDRLISMSDEELSLYLKLGGL